ncbi:imidazolonepropionase [Niabella sp. CC-SYL272]|uniref:imidazolonepropionase n=1 Tax=Niabella agricola TaxID=2891571 RepID=UPI001F353E90|nr:imidazolonepropionase [Niabella agricola]MCF3108914.1 imidazolonepropionase [Niabella agricola]
MHMEIAYYLAGPFRELVTMQALPLKGALKDSALRIIRNGGILWKEGWIEAVDDFETLASRPGVTVMEQMIKGVVLPGFIDMHTHLAFGGSRAADFALRNSGSTYLEIAESGGGIWSTVKATRALTIEALAALTAQRANALLQQGVTTIEVKSGYGLSVAEELKCLRAIAEARRITGASLVATCLAAHMLPADFNGSVAAYLELMVNELLPVIKEEQLARRVDAFIERSAFSAAQILPYFKSAKAMGFDITVHADQFTPSGTEVAITVGARSADHLEHSTDKEIALLAHADVAAVALPGASMGLGCKFAPVRKLLDAGCSVAIATDWNPGSAPMGNLMLQASVLASFEKLTNAEVLAAITYRAAAALGFKDRGVLAPGYRADFIVYDADSYQEIPYQQGRLQPAQVWKSGARIV